MLIYKITNNVNNKIYIGQTTKTLKERISNYEREVKYTKGRKERPISKAMKKYGFENFTFEVIEDNISTQAELDKKERYYIQYFNSLINQNGYNIELGGNGRGKHSEKTKRKISEAQLGEKNHMYGKVGSLNGMSKPIIDLTTGKIYESANLAAKDTNLNFSHICAVARGDRGSTGNRVFRYLDENNEIILPENFIPPKTKTTKQAVLEQYQWAI